MAIATTGGERQVLERLSTVDRFLPLWITLAMAAGLGLGSSKVRYERLGNLRGDRGLFSASLFLNWVVGPALMCALAWTFLPDQPEYRTGLIIVGLAPASPWS